MIEETFRGMWVIAYRELLRFLQERSRLLLSFAMPLLLLVIFGAGFGRVIGELAPGVEFVQFIYPGLLAMTVLMTSLMSGVSVVWDREFGFLKEVLVAPVSRTGIVLGKAVGAAAVAVVQGLGMLLIAPMIGISLSPVVVVKLIPLLAILSISLAGLGLLVASRMRSQQGFQLLMQLLIFPLIFLAGVFFPVDNVPPWLEVISKFNPLTYGVDAIRQVLLDAPPGTDLAMARASLGVTIFGQTMTVLEEAALMGLFGAVLLSGAAWSFNRLE